MMQALTCEECGEELQDVWRHRSTRRFCSDRCRYRHRDRAKYAADPEREREKSRAYYARNRERVIARVTARKREAVRGLK
jgi:endogenous inhibitor of DNA gyrase (YacG/DUF329 family)